MFRQKPICALKKYYLIVILYKSVQIHIASNRQIRILNDFIDTQLGLRWICMIDIFTSPILQVIYNIL